MENASSFSIFTFQKLSNGIKNSQFAQGLSPIFLSHIFKTPSLK